MIDQAKMVRKLETYFNLKKDEVSVTEEPSEYNVMGQYLEVSDKWQALDSETKYITDEEIIFIAKGGNPDQICSYRKLHNNLYFRWL